MRFTKLLSRLQSVIFLSALAFDTTAYAQSTLHATTSTFASVWSSAKGGDTILLASGNYGTFSGGSKSSTVTIQPEAGATPTMKLNFTPADHITLDGLTIAGAQLTGAHDIAVVNSTFTSPVQVDTTIVNANILFNNDKFDNLGTGTYEGRLTVRGYSNASAVGVTISNSHFGGGCSDGIQVIGNAYGVVIGPGNEFTGINQTGCDPTHVDPIQFYGDSHTTVTGNWFHDNGSGSGGIMSPDGSTGGIITNNVFASTGYAYAIICGGCTNFLVSHNTVNSAQSIHFASSNGGSASSGNTITNNIASGGIQGQGSTVTYNMYPNGASGTGNINGTPSFLGGAKPNTYAGYALTSNSAGRSAGSDGTDLGISLAGVPSDTTAPSVPTSLSANAVSSSQINLTWAASSDNVGVAGYKIFRGGTQIGTSTSASYSNTSLSASTTYSYTVSAYDAAGNNSAQSATASATTQTITPPDTSAPTVPTLLTATALSSSQINLAWSASSDNIGVTGYKIFRSGTQIGTSTSTSYSVLALAAATPYSFTVAAFDAAGNTSAQSASASATTLATSTCLTSSASNWQSASFTSKNSLFAVAYDDIPGGNSMDGVTGVSLSSATTYTSLAVITRFNNLGFIDAINGVNSYAAVTSVPYSAGGIYHFRVVIDPQAHTYSAFVTPPSAVSEIQIANNYAFRTDQAATSSLNSWSLFSEAGSTHAVCNFALAPNAPAALTATAW